VKRTEKCDKESGKVACPEWISLWTKRIDGNVRNSSFLLISSSTTTSALPNVALNLSRERLRRRPRRISSHRIRLAQSRSSLILTKQRVHFVPRPNFVESGFSPGIRAFRSCRHVSFPLLHRISPLSAFLPSSAPRSCCSCCWVFDAGKSPKRRRARQGRKMGTGLFWLWKRQHSTFLPRKGREIDSDVAVCSRKCRDSLPQEIKTVKWSRECPNPSRRIFPPLHHHPPQQSSMGRDPNPCHYESERPGDEKQAGSCFLGRFDSKNSWLAHTNWILSS